MPRPQQRWKVLKNEEQWDDWYDQSKAYLLSIGAWKYLDPDADPVWAEPAEPLPYRQAMAAYMG